MTKWRSPASAPMDCRPFLGLLSSNEVVKMWATMPIKRKVRYSWWGCYECHIPYEPSHIELLPDSLRLMAWLPMPCTDDIEIED